MNVQEILAALEKSALSNCGDEPETTSVHRPYLRAVLDHVAALERRLEAKEYLHDTAAKWSVTERDALRAKLAALESEKEHERRWEGYCEVLVAALEAEMDHVVALQAVAEAAATVWDSARVGFDLSLPPGSQHTWDITDASARGLEKALAAWRTASKSSASEDLASFELPKPRVLATITFDENGKPIVTEHFGDDDQSRGTE